MEKYMQCLSANQYDNSQCRLEAKEYLDCRMQKELMAKAEWSKLGYADLAAKDANTTLPPHPKPPTAPRWVWWLE